MSRHGSSASAGSRGRFPLYAVLVAMVAIASVRPALLQAQTTANWNTTSSGNWSNPLNWDIGVVPNNGTPAGSTYNVVLGDVDVPGNGSLGVREVTMDVTGATVNSVLVQEFPYPWPPSSPGPFDPYHNILTLGTSLTTTGNITLDGSWATLNLNGQNVNAATIYVDAPVFAYNQYWYRNRISGDATNTNDGVSEALSATPPAQTDGLPAATILGGYQGGYAVPTPSYIQPATGVATGPFTAPLGLTGSATTGTFNAALDTQGLVWLNGNPTLNGAVTNHSQWGLFRYDGSGGQAIAFNSTVNNSDPGAIMDINGAGNYAQAVTNQNGAYLFMRGASSITSTLTNQSGGQYLFQPSSTNPGALVITGNLTNQGAGTIQSPATGLLIPASSYMDIAGDFTLGHATLGVNVTNQDRAVMVMQGNTRIGLVDQMPLGSLPDIISSLINLTGATYTYQPTNSATQDMEITGQITNNGASTPMGYVTSMNLLGQTIVRGRSLASPIVTNINGAVLNYNALVDVGYDTLPNGQVFNQPQGNLNNDNGIINGYGSGNLRFRGGDQANGDATHTLSTINLYDTAQFTTGPQGSNTFTNYGSVNGYSGTPTFNSGIFNNRGTLTANSGSVFTMTSATAGAAAAVNNYGSVIVSTGGTLNTVGGLVNYSTLTFNSGGTINGPFIYNDLNGVINSSTGGVVSSTALANNVGGTMQLGNGTTAAALVVNSTNVTQAGLVNIAANFNLVINNSNLQNGGTINLNGLNANVAAPGALIVNNGQITGTGLLGFANAFGALTKQVVNSSSTSSITVGVGGMSIGGVLPPVNSGTINIGAGPTGLAIVGGAAGTTFVSSGTITLGTSTAGAVLVDLGTGKMLLNSGTISGNGAINFTNGIQNANTITAAGTGLTLTLNGNVLNDQPLAGGAITPGTINLEDGTAVSIPNMAVFTNNGTINFDSLGTGATLGGGAAGVLSNANDGQINVTGTNNSLAWGGGVTNAGTITINPAASLSYPAVAGMANTGFVSLTGGAALSGGPMNNTAGTVTATGGSSITTTTWNNTNGSLTVAGAGATLTTTAFTNDGALLTVAAGAVASVGATTNNSAGGAIGILQVNNGGAFNTTAALFTNSGSVTVANSSKFTTNNGAGVGVGAYGGFTNNSGVATIGGSSLFDVGVVAQNNGIISIAGGSAADTLAYTLTGGQLTLNGPPMGAGLPAVTLNVRGALTNTGGSISILGGATTTVTGAFANTGASATATLSGASTISVNSLANTGTLDLEGGSTLTSTTGPDTNIGGTIDVAGAGASLTVNNLNNTGGSLTLENGATASVGALTNNNGGMATGTVVADENSTVTTSSITNAGTLTATNGSTIQTGVLIVFGQLTTSGTVSANTGSLINVGTMTQNGGTVSIDGGSALATFGYTLNGGAATFSTASTLTILGFPRSTLGATTLTNNDGLISFIGGATGNIANLLNIGGAFANSGASATTTLTGASTLRVGTLTNTGTFNVESGSTFTSTTGPDSNNSGTMDVTGAGTTAAVNMLDNTSGELTVDNAGVLNNAGMLTNNVVGAVPGTIVVDEGATLNSNTGSVTNGGTVLVEAGGIFNSTGAMTTFTNNGIVTVTGMGSALNTFNLTVNAGSTLKASAMAAVTLNGAGVLTIAGGATLIADPGGTIMTAGNGDTNSGDILVSGAASTFATGPAAAKLGSLSNFGTIGITDGGTVNLASTMTSGTITVSGMGSALNVDPTNLAGKRGLLNNTANISISSNATASVGSFMNYGVVTVDTGSTFTSATIGNMDENSGQFSVLGAASATFGGFLNNLGGGTLSVIGSGNGKSTLTINGNFTNGNNVNVTGANATLNLNGAAVLLQNGLVNVQGFPGSPAKVNSGAVWKVGVTAGLIVGPDGNVDPPSITSSGSISIESGGILQSESFESDAMATTTIDGTLQSPVSVVGGTVQGGGTVMGSVDDSGGAVTPGGVNIASRVLTITGGYSQEPAGQLVISISSKTSWTALDVTADGTIVNGGTIALMLSPSYVPQIGDTFEVIDSPAGVTENDPYSVTQTINYSNGFFEAQYTPTQVNVVFAPEPASAGVMLLASATLLLGSRRRFVGR